MNPHVIAIATIDRAKTVLIIPINTIIPPHITTRRLPRTEAKAPASGPIIMDQSNGRSDIAFHVSYNVKVR